MASSGGDDRRLLLRGRQQLAALRFPAMPALTDPWTLGGRTLENRLVLAPLAGIGNWFVRLQARRFGAGLVTSEMVSSFGLAYGNERTVTEFLRIHPDEHPVSIQLFGHDVAVMREAAALVAAAGADYIDLTDLKGDWKALLDELDPTSALLEEDSPLAYYLTEVQGWSVAGQESGFTLLVRPT